MYGGIGKAVNRATGGRLFCALGGLGVLVQILGHNFGHVR